jgi:hypothetical protein
MRGLCVVSSGVLVIRRGDGLEVAKGQAGAGPSNDHAALDWQSTGRAVKWL